MDNLEIAIYNLSFSVPTYSSFIEGISSLDSTIKQLFKAFQRVCFSHTSPSLEKTQSIKLAFEPVEEDKRIRNIANLAFLFSLSSLGNRFSFRTLFHKFSSSLGLPLSFRQQYLPEELPEAKSEELWKILQDAHKGNYNQKILFQELKKSNSYQKSDLLGKGVTYLGFFIFEYILDLQDLSGQIYTGLMEKLDSYNASSEKKWKEALIQVFSDFSQLSKHLTERYMGDASSEKNSMEELCRKSLVKLLSEVSHKSFPASSEKKDSKKPEASTFKSTKDLDISDFNHFIKNYLTKINGSTFPEIYALFFKKYLASLIPKVRFFHSQIKSCSLRRSSWLSLPFFYLFSVFGAIFGLPVNLLIKRLLYSFAPTLLASSTQAIVDKVKTPALSNSLLSFLKDLTERLKHTYSPSGTTTTAKSCKQAGEHLLAVLKALHGKTPMDMRECMQKDLAELLSIAGRASHLVTLDPKIAEALGEVLSSSIQAFVSPKNMKQLKTVFLQVFDGQFQQKKEITEESMLKEAQAAENQIFENLKTLYENIITQELASIIPEETTETLQQSLQIKWEQFQRVNSRNEIQNRNDFMNMEQRALEFANKVQEENLPGSIKEVLTEKFHRLAGHAKKIHALLKTSESENLVLERCKESVSEIDSFLQKENASPENFRIPALLKLDDSSIEKLESFLTEERSVESENSSPKQLIRLREELTDIQRDYTEKSKEKENIAKDQKKISEILQTAKENKTYLQTRYQKRTAQLEKTPSALKTILKAMEFFPFIREKTTSLHNALNKEGQRITNLESSYKENAKKLRELLPSIETQRDIFFEKIAKYRNFLSSDSTLIPIKPPVPITVSELIQRSLKNTEKEKALYKHLFQKELSTPPSIAKISPATPSGVLATFMALFGLLGFSFSTTSFITLLLFSMQNPKPLGIATTKLTDATKKSSEFTIKSLKEFLAFHSLTDIFLHTFYDTLNRLGPGFWKDNS